VTSFVAARTKEDAIVMLDEWDDAEGAEIIQIRDFMVDFRLNDEGDLDRGICRYTILSKAYPRLLDAMKAAPTTPAGRTTDEGKVMVREAVEEERKRPLKPTRSPQPATEAARTLQEKMGPLPRTRIEPLKRSRPGFSARLLAAAGSSS
jgi:hypothetical protein